MRSSRILVILCGLVAAGVTNASAQSAPASIANTCVACHSALSDARLAAIGLVYLVTFTIIGHYAK